MLPDRLHVLSEIADTVRADLRADRRLRYVLLLAVVLSGFWFWWRSPNFATPDEYGRLLRPMKAGGEFVADPSYSSFVRGATDGVPQGASFYLYAITLIPAALLVLLTGRLDEFSSFAGYASRWDLWYAVPEWFWHATILSARLVNVLIAVSCVYVVYRIGTEAWDRRAGFYGALTLALMLAFLASAHEADEDTAMVLALLVTTYLALRYAQTGTRRYAYWGAFAGGLAISFKLTAGSIVFVLLAALVVRARTDTEAGWRGILDWARKRPRLIAAMAVVGAATIYVGRPHVLLEGPEAILHRATWASSYSSATAGDAPPPGYESVRALLAAAGIPLATAIVCSVGWHTVRLRANRAQSVLPSIVLPGIAVYILVFGSWSHIRPHHILPAVVLGVVLLAGPLARMERPDSNRWLRVLGAVLLLTTALFAGAGMVSIATDPRDQATRWADGNVAENETILVYDNSVADIGTVHGRPVEHYDFVERTAGSGDPENESAFTEWILSSPEREPEYILVTGSGVGSENASRGTNDGSPPRQQFFDRLIDGDHFGYEVAAEYGERPIERSYAADLVHAGIEPTVEKREPYVLILRHPDAAD